MTGAGAIGPSLPAGPPQSEGSAIQAPSKRVIDENTDMSTLTDQDIMRLMEQSGHAEDVMTKPLISTPVPLMVIKDEYKSGSAQVMQKLEWLESQGWDQVWRARGDGDCFYRSFTMGYLLRILHSPDPALSANLAYEAIQRALPAMQQVGFDPDLYDMFLDPLLALVRSFTPSSTSAEPPTEYSLIQSLQDAETSNCVVVALRLIAAAWIRTHPDDFAPFLFSPTTFEPLDPEEFCRQEVEPCGKEADHVQITALAGALGVGIRIAYLDRSEVSEGEGPLNWVEFGLDKPKDADEAAGELVAQEPLTLLYRPGHYDVLTKDHPPTDV